MKICFFYEGLRPGGIEHMISNLSFEFVRRGHKLTLFLVASPTDRDYEVHSSTNVIWLRRTDASARRAIGAFAAHLRRNSYDIILSAMPQFNNAAVVARVLARSMAANVLTERTNPFADYAQESSFSRRIWHKSSALFYRLAQARIAVSAGLADDLARFEHLDRGSIDVIHNPAFKGTPSSTEEIRTSPPHAWTLDGRGPVIVGAGRFVKQKDFPTLLRSFARLRRMPAGENARLVILGDGQLRGELTREADALGISSCVAFPGFVADIRPTLAAARFFVMSSAWEGFGNVLVEALACGCSIVSTDCPNGPSEILDKGRFGSLVPVGDTEKMAQAIAQLLDRPANPDLQLARAQEFSIAVAASRYESIFNRVVRR